VAVTNSGGIVPTQAVNWTANNLNCSTCGIEVDKLVDTATINGGSVYQLLFQSSSVHNFNLNGGAVVASVVGTPEIFNCSGSTITTLKLGATAYGRSLAFNGNNCEISNPITYVSPYLPTSTYSIASGVLLKSFAAGPIQWAIPGARMFFAGAMEYEGGPFTLAGLTTDGADTYAAMSLIGGWPTLPLEGGSSLFIQVDPMPNWNCTGCTGGLMAADLSQPGAQGAPIFTYSQRTYTCAANLSNVPGAIDINAPPVADPTIWGAPVSVTVNVITPDTSATSPLIWHPLSQFGAAYVNAAGAQAKIDEPINLKIGGARVITPTAVTGAQNGDALINLAGVVTLGTALAPFSPGAPNVAATCPVVSVALRASR
jgi:hypothetical protein